MLGEFGHMIADQPEATRRSRSRCSPRSRERRAEVRALLLNTFVKLAHSYAEIVPQVTELLTASSSAMDQEIQQRSNEYLALASPQMSEVKTTVLEMMPHFTERESIVQKQLDKAKGERVSKTRDDDDDDDDDARGDRAPAPAVPQPTRAPSDLISGLGDEPAPRPATAPTPSGAADLLGARPGRARAAPRRQPAALTTCSASLRPRPRPRPPRQPAALTTCSAAWAVRPRPRPRQRRRRAAAARAA